MAPLQWTKYMDFASYVTYWCLYIFIENMERKAHEAHNIPHKWDLEDPPSARDLIKSELGDWARGSLSSNDCLQLLDNCISWTDSLCQMWIASLLKCFPEFLGTDIRQKSFSINTEFLELKLTIDFISNHIINMPSNTVYKQPQKHRDHHPLSSSFTSWPPPWKKGKNFLFKFDVSFL